MKICAFVLRMDGENREALISAVAALKADFASACEKYNVKNFSVWHMEQYLFGYGESLSEDMACFDGVFAKLPEGASLICAPGTMRQMYHDIGVVREDKSLIRHRVFATKLKPGCAEEYKARHGALIAARGDTVKEGPESNFTIWHAYGYIFGYCELVKSFDHEMTEAEKADTIAWETRQLEIMDWLTDDVDWITGERHEPIRRLV